eukprot:CAMPEP_0113701548 /NCGR_PEP_ID=MMETSP0038_2-20120614/24643_1 /TAXON_ID=2898 /ORGANISM="Cryptomonas paramecium" /LENGTH=185 /DNA_ID=CAMNT_0000625467 /DNA_START=92 /DNA_END=646 /DNA_ORIENTATION=+ /assembly_acc=CAM_ASM_000170
MSPRTIELLASVPQYQILSSASNLWSAPVSGTLTVPDKVGKLPASANFVVSNIGGPPADIGSTVPLVSAGGNSIGSANVRVRRTASPSPPTIVRYGDVGVTPKGCPTCPVLDNQVVELQKEQIADNEARIERLQAVVDANKRGLEEGIEGMRLLKAVMHNAVFNLKEDLRKENLDVKAKMKALAS